MPILAFNIEVGILPGLNPGILAVNAISDNFSLILSSISFAEITILNSRLSPFEFFFVIFIFSVLYLIILFFAKLGNYTVKVYTHLLLGCHLQLPFLN